MSYRTNFYALFGHGLGGQPLREAAAQISKYLSRGHVWYGAPYLTNPYAPIHPRNHTEASLTNSQHVALVHDATSALDSLNPYYTNTKPDEYPGYVSKLNDAVTELEALYEDPALTPEEPIFLGTYRWVAYLMRLVVRYAEYEKSLSDPATCVFYVGQGVEYVAMLGAFPKRSPDSTSPTVTVDLHWLEPFLDLMALMDELLIRFPEMAVYRWHNRVASFMLVVLETATSWTTNGYPEDKDRHIKALEEELSWLVNDLYPQLESFLVEGALGEVQHRQFLLASFPELSQSPIPIAYEWVRVGKVHGYEEEVSPVASAQTMALFSQARAKERENEERRLRTGRPY